MPRPRGAEGETELLEEVFVPDGERRVDDDGDNGVDDKGGDEVDDDRVEAEVVVASAVTEVTMLVVAVGIL